MGSGIFVGAVVVAWFVVLVPMVLTRRDAAAELALTEDHSAAARVLRRTRRHHRTSLDQGSSGMSARESSPSPDRLDASWASYNAYDTGVAYDDPTYDDTVDTAVTERVTAEVVDDQAPLISDEDESAPTDLIAKRRRTLLMLLGLAAVTLLVALVVGSWTWIPMGIAAVMAIGYVVHLRNEARRREELRLTRDRRGRRTRVESVGRRDESRSQSSLAANAFVATPVTAPEPVLLDDEDPAFYDLADAPVSERVDLTGHDYYSEYQDVDYDYGSDDYGIQAAGTDEGYDYPKAV